MEIIRYIKLESQLGDSKNEGVSFEIDENQYKKIIEILEHKIKW